MEHTVRLYKQEFLSLVYCLDFDVPACIPIFLITKIVVNAQYLVVHGDEVFYFLISLGYCVVYTVYVAVGVMVISKELIKMLTYCIARK